MSQRPNPNLQSPTSAQAGMFICRLSDSSTAEQVVRMFERSGCQVSFDPETNTIVVQRVPPAAEEAA